MKDRSSLRYFVGLEVTQSSSCILFSQQKYISDILDRDVLIYDKIADISLQLNVKLRLKDGFFQNPHISTLGWSAFLLCISRLDIFHVVGIVSQYVIAPWLDHNVTLLRILRYVHGSVT